jgi:glycosyltransferase involved in cell wall biosynthesis
MAGSGVPDRTAPVDWPPLFDVSQFDFAPREQLTWPVVIGRHGRDHPGKWPEDPNEIKAAYPLRDDVRIDILGGADTVAERLGGLPANWSVKGFGAFAVNQYLHSLDVFVYFPARARSEAFGRTVIEAVLSGVPVILPRQLSPTFGEIALYCEPSAVYDLIVRLAADDEGRKKYLRECRQISIDRYGSHALAQRLAGGDIESPPALALSAESKAFRVKIMGTTEPVLLNAD